MYVMESTYVLLPAPRVFDGRAHKRYGPTSVWPGHGGEQETSAVECASRVKRFHAVPLHCRLLAATHAECGEFDVIAAGVGPGARIGDPANATTDVAEGAAALDVSRRGPEGLRVRGVRRRAHGEGALGGDRTQQQHGRDGKDALGNVVENLHGRYLQNIVGQISHLLGTILVAGAVRQNSAMYVRENTDRCGETKWPDQLLAGPSRRNEKEGSGQAVNGK